MIKIDTVKISISLLDIFLEYRVKVSLTLSYYQKLEICYLYKIFIRKYFR